MNATQQEIETGVPGWVLGTVLTTLSAFSSTFGTLAMKKSQQIEDKKAAEGKKSTRLGSIPIASPWWWAGFFSACLRPRLFPFFGCCVCARVRAREHRGATQNRSR